MQQQRAVFSHIGYNMMKLSDEAVPLHAGSYETNEGDNVPASSLISRQTNRVLGTYLCSDLHDRSSPVCQAFPHGDLFSSSGH